MIGSLPWLLLKGNLAQPQLFKFMAAMISDEPEFIAQYLTSLSSRSVRYGADHTPFRPTPKKLKVSMTTTIHPVPLCASYSLILLKNLTETATQ